jgi:photosystem II biogenesis protein Psp29
VNSVRTVSDTKRAFYSAHTRPINSIYRRVVDELMVEMHLLAVNSNFVYSPIYALGVVTTFDRFMNGYRPEADINPIFQALCAAVGGDASKYRQDAEALKSSLVGASWEQFVQGEVSGLVGQSISTVSSNEKFKYSRLFGVGLYTLLEQLDTELVKDKEKLSSTLEKLTSTLHLSNERLEKDLELYRGNLDKMEQAQQAIADTIAADRKRREQRDQGKSTETSATSPEPVLESTDASPTPPPES